jgi:hypothetical protein
VLGRGTGRSTRKVVPTRSALAIETVPPWASAIARTMTRPSPVPWIAARRAFEERKKRSKS